MIQCCPEATHQEWMKTKSAFEIMGGDGEEGFVWLKLDTGTNRVTRIDNSATKFELTSSGGKALNGNKCVDVKNIRRFFLKSPNFNCQ